MPGTKTLIRTRKQLDMELALECIDRVSKLDREIQDNYGRLCHKLPIMTRTCGLCQTLAFIEDKKSKNDPRGSAYKQLHDDIKKLLGVTGGLLETVRDAPLHDYIRYTRRLLGGWVFFKRFAVSILKVETPANDGEKP